MRAKALIWELAFLMPTGLRPAEHQDYSNPRTAPSESGACSVTAVCCVLTDLPT